MSESSVFTAEEFQELQKGKKKSKQKEESIQIAVCNYIRLKYPDVIFTCDLASGLKLPIWIAAKHKKMRSSKGLPDLFIAKPVFMPAEYYVGGIKTWGHVAVYCGLFIELKQESVRLKNGCIASSPHHAEQAEILDRLNQLGYKAVFGCGFSECIKIIDDYLNPM